MALVRLKPVLAVLDAYDALTDAEQDEFLAMFGDGKRRRRRAR